MFERRMSEAGIAQKSLLLEELGAGKRYFGAHVVRMRTYEARPCRTHYELYN